MTEEDPLGTDFARKHPEAFARILGRAEATEIAEVLDTMPAAVAATIASKLPASRIQALLASGQHEEARWLSDAPLDDAKTLLSRIPREHSLTLVNSITDRKRKRKLLQHLNYPAHSLGALVTDAAVRFSSDAPTTEVLAELRALESGFRGRVVIVHPDGRYFGTLNLWQLLVNEKPGGSIRNFTVPTPTLRPEISLLSAIKDKNWLNHNWLPVVDHNDHLLGGVSRKRIFAAAPKEQSNRSTHDVFATLISDVMRLMGEILHWVFSPRSAR